MMKNLTNKQIENLLTVIDWAGDMHDEDCRRISEIEIADAYKSVLGIRLARKADQDKREASKRECGKMSPDTKRITPKEVLAAAVGIPAYIVCRELGIVTPGIDWTGCGKGHAIKEAMRERTLGSVWLPPTQARNLRTTLRWIRRRMDMGMPANQAANELALERIAETHRTYR